MRGLQDAVNRIADDGSYFVRAKDVRLWVIDAKGVPQNAWAKIAVGLEHHPDNFSPFIVLEDAFTRASEGFQERAIRLVAHWKRRCDEMAKEHVELSPVELPNGSTPGETFGRTVRALAEAVRPPLDGLVMLLAPTIVETPAVVEKALETLVGAPSIANVRWVFVHDGSAPLETLRRTLGAAVLVTEARVPDDDFAKGIEEMLANSEGNDRRFGQVWPKGVVPPTRIDAPPSIPPEELEAKLRAAGVPPELAVGDAGPRLRRCLLEAANAARKGQSLDAVRWQKDACDLTKRLGMNKEHLVSRMGLAGYFQLAKRPDLAVREYTETAASAIALEETMIAAQAFLGLGMLEGLAKRYGQAGAAYVRAAELAQEAKVEALAIEAYRLAGQLALDIRADRQAIESFTRAIRIADETTGPQLKLSSAPLAARSLAAVYKKLGQHEHARLLYDRADAYEAASAGTSAS